MNDPRPQASRRLAAAGIDSPRLDARLLWDAAQRSTGQYERLLQRRLAHEPLAYITGSKEFWSLQFDVAPGVLIPRPASETVIEQVLERFGDAGAPLKILDLGTGSGCLLAALLKEYPNASGLGIDRSETALALAARNLDRLGLQRRAKLLRGDWFEGLSGPFEVIVSNPPYIPSADIAGLDPEVRDFEPRGALDGGPDGLDGVRALAAGLARLAAGTAFIEIGAGQAETASAILAGHGWPVHHVAPDLAGIPRVLVTAAEAK